MSQEADGILLGGIELGDQILMRSKTRNPAFDFTRGNRFP